MKAGAGLGHVRSTEGFKNRGLTDEPLPRALGALDLLILGCPSLCIVER